MDSQKHLANASLGKKSGLPLPQELGQPPPLVSATTAWGQPGAQSGGQQVLQTQDWVCQPAESGRRSHRWSVSIDERRRLAVQGGRERPGTAGPPSHSRDLSRLVAQLVSEDVDKDVLLPHAPRPSEAANAFQAFLAPSAPFWQTVTLEAQAGVSSSSSSDNASLPGLTGNPPGPALPLLRKRTSLALQEHVCSLLNNLRIKF
ncbi:testis-expressed protein 22 isoform X2 [Felis catus]|uniref:testis-expressed protein 22 isoform X2 n=1 Tax=Felis catus TaxID=9685 RepID=UPI001D19B936|nr:testis-expressed protein 22 isoform X2 [Felis catus]